MSSPIRKYCDYYYQVIETGDRFGWVIYNQYKPEEREVMQENDEPCLTEEEAEQDARDAISYHY